MKFRINAWRLDSIVIEIYYLNIAQRLFFNHWCKSRKCSFVFYIKGKNLKYLVHTTETVPSFLYNFVKKNLYQFLEEKKMKKITAIRGHGILIELTCKKYWFCKVQYYKTTVNILLLIRKNDISIILKMSLSVVQTKQEDRL